MSLIFYILDKFCIYYTFIGISLACLFLLCLCIYKILSKRSKSIFLVLFCNGIISELKSEWSKKKIKELKKMDEVMSKNKESKKILSKDMVITPHLTIYYPLETALVSVLIRFMGVLALFLLILLLGISLISSLYSNIYFFLIIKLILKICLIFILVGSLIYHIYKVYSHY
jgi:hypothetical protein